MSHLGTGSCAAPDSQALSLNMWMDTSGEQQYLLVTPCLPRSHRDKSGDSKEPPFVEPGDQGSRPGSTALSSKVFLLALPLPKGTSHLNYPQLNSSLCPQRSVTLSGNSTNTPSHPARHQAVIRGVLSPSLPHTSDPSPRPRASTSQQLLVSPLLPLMPLSPFSLR